jgi:hypothetical protein
MPVESIAAVLGGFVPCMLIVVLAIADFRGGVVLDELRRATRPKDLDAT